MFKELRAFQGTVVINGSPVEVEFTSSGLYICNISAAEAFDVLERLTGSKASLVSELQTQPSVTKTTEDVVVYVTEHQDIPQPMDPPKKRESKKAEAEIVEEAPAPAPVVETVTKSDDLFDPTMNNVGTLKELIIILADKGLKTEEQFISAINSLEERVDLLKHMQTNRDSRVSRIVATLDLGA